MYKTRSALLSPLSRNVVGLLALVFFLLAGCAKSAIPIVETTPPANLEITLTPQIDIEFTPTSEAEITESTPRVSPYIKLLVENVEIRYLETNPVQVEIVIRGALPDQCKYEFYSIENRAGQNVKISLSGIHPADNSCSQTAQTIEYVLGLGRDMPDSERGFSPGDYKLTVNNYETSFSIK